MSQANLLAVANFPDEVNPSGLNNNAMKEMDEFLLEDQDEEPSAMGFDNLNIIDSEQVDKYLRMDSKKSRSKANSRRNSKRGGKDNDKKETPLPRVVNLSESSDSLKKKAHNLKELKELESEDSILGDTTRKEQVNHLLKRAEKTLLPSSKVRPWTLRLRPQKRRIA